MGVALTEEMCRETMGLRLDAAVDHWGDRFGLEPAQRAGVAAGVLQRMVELVGTRGVPLPGVDHALAVLERRGLRLGVCSGSAPRIIRAALDRLGIVDRVQAVRSSYDDEHGKPHPASFLATAAALDADPARCVAFEDSLNGAIAAKAARMKVVAVPEPAARTHRRWGFCDAELASLEEVDDALLDALERRAR